MIDASGPAGFDGFATGRLTQAAISLTSIFGTSVLTAAGFTSGSGRRLDKRDLRHDRLAAHKSDRRERCGQRRGDRQFRLLGRRHDRKMSAFDGFLRFVWLIIGLGRVRPVADFRTCAKAMMAVMRRATSATRSASFVALVATMLASSSLCAAAISSSSARSSALIVSVIFGAAVCRYGLLQLRDRGEQLLGVGIAVSPGIFGEKGAAARARRQRRAERFIVAVVGCVRRGPSRPRRYLGRHAMCNPCGAVYQSCGLIRPALPRRCRRGEGRKAMFRQ